MVHGTRIKIMARLHNYGTVWQRWGTNYSVCYQQAMENRQKETKLIYPKMSIFLLEAY